MMKEHFPKPKVIIPMDEYQHYQDMMDELSALMEEHDKLLGQYDTLISEP